MRNSKTGLATLDTVKNNAPTFSSVSKEILNKIHMKSNLFTHLGPLIFLIHSGLGCWTSSGVVIRAVDFSSGGYKIRKIFAVKSTYPKETFEF